MKFFALALGLLISAQSMAAATISTSPVGGGKRCCDKQGNIVSITNEKQCKGSPGHYWLPATVNPPICFKQSECCQANLPLAGFVDCTVGIDAKKCKNTAGCHWNPKCTGGSGGGSDTGGGTGTGTGTGQSGKCCKVKPNANPVIDCSVPLLNYQPTIPNAYQRCVQANGGNSCQWDINNKECCPAGVPCGGPSPSPTPSCLPPNTWVSYPFQSLAQSNPTEYARCKQEAGSNTQYRCCARPGTGGGSDTNNCAPPSILVSFPFQALATNPALASEYNRCKTESAGNPAYRCCVNPVSTCTQQGGTMVNGGQCPGGTQAIFGPFNGTNGQQICCKQQP